MSTPYPASFLHIKRIAGFTLAELLIALAVLGVIATFTIPKVLNGLSGPTERLAKAKEATGVVAEAVSGYLRENSGCFPGVTCRFDPATGTPQDGLPASRNTTHLAAYLDKHLNFIEKKAWGGWHFYQFGNGYWMRPLSIGTAKITPSQYEVRITFQICLECELDTVGTTWEYAERGVDTQSAFIYAYRNGAIVPGRSNAEQIRVGDPYDGFVADIFDYPEHPDDTCEVVGGWKCELAGF